MERKKLPTFVLYKLLFFASKMMRKYDNEQSD